MANELGRISGKVNAKKKLLKMCWATVYKRRQEAVTHVKRMMRD
jgi:hypothetical protein